VVGVGRRWVVGDLRSVLGIDAAWTASQPSGVALAVGTSSGWRLVAVAASYGRFHAAASGRDPEPRPAGSVPVAADLLASAWALAGCPVGLVAIDMPLSLDPVTGRRASDDAVSRAYGARGAGTHTPSAVRPGPIADGLRLGFERAGYPLRTSAAESPGLIEVYPHPALVEFASAPERLRYKIARARRYWPGLDPAERRGRLADVWRGIVGLLDARMAGVAEALAIPAAGAPGIALKAFEDELDAVVCACVAACAMDGTAEPFGDARSAIWVPAPSHSDGHRPW
jgi:predicted RNase H-like nuclease